MAYALLGHRRWKSVHGGLLAEGRLEALRTGVDDGLDVEGAETCRQGLRGHECHGHLLVEEHPEEQGQGISVERHPSASARPVIHKVPFICGAGAAAGGAAASGMGKRYRLGGLVPRREQARGLPTPGAGGSAARGARFALPARDLGHDRPRPRGLRLV